MAIAATQALAEPAAIERSDDGLPMPRRLLAIALISAGSVLYTLDANIATVALPTIARALHVPPSSAVMLVAGYNLVLAMVLLPLAALADRVGQRRIFALGLLCYLGSAIACYSAGSFGVLLAARAVQALAAAAVLSVSLAMVRAIYPAAVLGRGLGLNTVAASLGAAIAPALGGLIISVASWHWVFAAGAPLALLALGFSGALPDSERRDEPYDTLGAVLCALTFGLFIFGFQALSGKVPPGVAGGCIAAAMVTAVLFVRHEMKTALPVLPVDLLAQPALALSVGAALLTVLASTSLLLYIPFRLSALGFGTAEIGAMIAPYALAVMIAAPASGMLSDRVSPTLLGTIGLGIALVGIVCMAGLPHAPGYRDVVWRIVLCGAGFSMFFSPNGRLIVGSVPRHRAAGASSLTSTTRMFGQSLGSTLLGAMLALHLAAAAPAFASAGFALIALLCSAARMVVGRESPQDRQAA